MNIQFLSREKLTYGAKIALYALAAFLPLLFLPRPFDLDLGRGTVFAALIIIACVLWLGSLLEGGEIRWRQSPILWGALILAASFAASASASSSPWVSALFADVSSERLVTILLALVLMIVAGSMLRREEAGTIMLVVIFSGAISAVLTAIQLLWGWSLLRVLGLVPDASANVVGTMNGLVLIYAALFMIAIGLFCSSAMTHWRSAARWALGGAAALFLLDIFLINFLTAWIAVLGGAVVLFGLLLIDGITRQPDAAPRLRGRNLGVGILVVVAVMMILGRGLVSGISSVPVEVSPSLASTLSITKALYREGPARVFFGSGPGTFGLLWAHYKDPVINQTIFWGTRFVQGQSWVSTMLGTVGVLGTVSFLLFLAAACATFLRALLGMRYGSVVSGDGEEYDGEDAAPPHGVNMMALGRALFAGFVALVIGAFLYPATLTFLTLFFLVIGLATVVLARPAPGGREVGPRRVTGPTSSAVMTAPEPSYDIDGGEAAAAGFHQTPGTAGGSSEGSFWDIRERVIRFTAPWTVFVSSLALIFFIALGAIGLWMQANHARAGILATRGVNAAAAGNLDDGIGLLRRASEIEPQDFHPLALLVQARAEKVRSIIQRAGRGENVQQEFQAAVSVAVQDAQRLAGLYPADPNLWRIQAGLYELLIPYIQGSERFASAAYQEASEREPANPDIYTAWGRAGLSFADRIAAAANQSSGKDREELVAAYRQNLEETNKLFARATDLKRDYAPAHFLLAQSALRLGDLERAIRNVEDAKAAAPFDIGVAFQLGLLYYQKGNLDKAQIEFERAVSLNDTYSNARYFLGLIYDRKGDKQRAAAEFTKISQLNPDNDEVKRILTNLAAGKAALDGIVPPAEAPEKRKDAPVSDRKGR